MHILGISCYYHDAAAALLRDGQLVAAAEEERFSRKKHDFDFPANAIQFCLREAGIDGRDLDYVVFFKKPFRKFDRILASVLQTYPQSLKVFRESMIGWMLDKLWVASTLQSELGIDREKILFSDHHISHAASAFFCSPYEEAAILTVDGVGEWTTTAYGVGRGTQIHLTKQVEFPHSIGLLYSAFTAFLGFEVNEGEYKVMGMAPYGTPRYVDKVWKVVRVSEDGAIRLDLDYFSYHHTPERAFSSRFLTLFGQPRAAGAPAQSEYYADVAASLQHVTEEILLRMARAACTRSGLKKLVMAGGVALNAVANGRIQDEAGIEELYVQPSAGDGGGALGAALWAWHMMLGRPRGFQMRHASWGRNVSVDETRAALARVGPPSGCLKSEDG